MTLNDDYLSPAAFWFLVAAFVVGTVVLAIVEHAHRRAEAKAAIWARIATHPTPARVHPHCAAFGHAFRPHQTVFLCGVCGDRIPRDTLDQEPA